MMIEIFEQLVANSSRVLDLCAAPGGKSTHLATMLAEDAVLIANEVIRGRVSVLRENIDKWGDGRVTVTSFDPSLFKYKYREGFDFILVDAPCSGEGLFRKNPKAISEWSLRAVNECAARQRRIVTDIWSTLEPGGYLSYATCTMNRIENEDNVAWFAENLDAEIINLAPFLKHKDDVIVNESGAIRLHPSLFLSLLRKRGSGVRRRARVKSRSKGEVPEYWEALRVRAEWPSAELSKEQALAYLSREILVLPDAPIGYLMVTYGGLGLGFVKNIGSRANNLLPKSMRILNR